MALDESVQCLTKLRDSNLAIQTRFLGRKGKISKRLSTLPMIILEESDIELDINSGPREERVENMEVTGNAVKKRTWTKLSRTKSEKQHSSDRGKENSKSRSFHLIKQSVEDIQKTSPLTSDQFHQISRPARVNR